MRSVCLIAAIVVFGIAPAIAADMAPAATANTAKGPVLVDGKQMTLYTFAKDPRVPRAYGGLIQEQRRLLRQQDEARKLWRKPN